MFQYDMEKRLNIDEIMEHPWIQGDEITTEELTAELKKRNQIILNGIAYEEYMVKAQYQKSNNDVTT